jgi:hypothetical protein
MYFATASAQSGMLSTIATIGCIIWFAVVIFFMLFRTESFVSLLKHEREMKERRAERRRRGAAAGFRIARMFLKK